MTDDEVKKLYKSTPPNDVEIAIYNNGDFVHAGFQTGFRTAERLAKIEVLEELIKDAPDYAETVNLLYIRSLIAQLKASN